MFNRLLFTGTLRHRRFSPKAHGFSYKVRMFCFEPAQIEMIVKKNKHISIERFNWFSFRRKHYLNHPEIPLDEYARQLVAEKFSHYPKGALYLLTHLSCFGYCFNPISLYFILDETNQHLDYLILEVTNTPWGERHNYVLKNNQESTEGRYHFQFKKELHVSPFLAMNYTYQFNLKLTEHEIIVHMENLVDEKKDFDATLMLRSMDKNKTPVKNVLKGYPFMTHKLTLALYWQAFQLWMKGVSFHPHPKTDKRT